MLEEYPSLDRVCLNNIIGYIQHCQLDGTDIRWDLIEARMLDEVNSGDDILLDFSSYPMQPPKSIILTNILPAMAAAQKQKRNLASTACRSLADSSLTCSLAFEEMLEDYQEVLLDLSDMLETDREDMSMELYQEVKQVLNLYLQITSEDGEGEDVDGEVLLPRIGEVVHYASDCEEEDVSIQWSAVLNIANSPSIEQQVDNYM